MTRPSSQSKSSPPRPSLPVEERGGRALPETVRAQMERRLGADFDDVRVHTGSAAAAATERLEADAVTVGDDIFFRAGRFRPETTEGQRLLAHELTHVAQERLEGVPASAAAVEREADASAAKIAAGRPARVRQPAVREAPHAKRSDPPPQRHAEREATVGQFYVARFAVQGFDIRVAIQKDQKDHIVGRLGDVAAALARINRQNSDQKLKVTTCVIVYGEDSRFATYGGKPVAVISQDDALAPTAIHEGAHAVFESLRGTTGKNAETQRNIAGQLAEIYAQLSSTKKVTHKRKDPFGDAVEESHPVGLWMIDPTQWNGEPKAEHPWKDADEMFASATEAFLTKPENLRRAIAAAVRADKRVEAPAKALLQILTMMGKNKKPNAPKPSTEAEKAVAEIPEPSKLEESIGYPVHTQLKWALEPDTAPDGD